MKVDFKSRIFISEKLGDPLYPEFRKAVISVVIETMMSADITWNGASQALISCCGRLATKPLNHARRRNPPRSKASATYRK
jgi:hypothetical protein